MRLIPYTCAVLALISTGCNSPQREPPSGSTAASMSNESPSDVRLPVTVGKKSGFIDGTGKLVINPQYEYVEAFSEGLAMVCIGECDADHRIMGYRIRPNSGEREWLERSFKFGFIDVAGKLVINPMFEWAQAFREGLAAVCVGQGCYGIDLQHPSEIREQKWGYIDKTGAMVIPPQFDHAQSFHDGLASVSVGGKVGYIDKAGRFVINPQFAYGEDFVRGIAHVAIGKLEQPDAMQYGYIDKTGKYIWQPSN